MKTAMQELIEALKEYQKDKSDNHEMLIGLKIAESLSISKLEKEKQQIIDAVDNMANPLIGNDVIVSQINFNGTYGEKYYNNTFNTKEDK